MGAHEQIQSPVERLNTAIWSGPKMCYVSTQNGDQYFFAGNGTLEPHGMFARVGTNLMNVTAEEKKAALAIAQEAYRLRTAQGQRLDAAFSIPVK